MHDEMDFRNHLHHFVKGRLVLGMFLCLFAVFTSSWRAAAKPTNPKEGSEVFLGAIFTFNPTRPPSKPTSTPNTNDPCSAVNQSVQQQAMIKLLTDKALQKRPVFRCNPILMAQAMRKANDMVQRRYYGHVDPDGFGMNYFLRRAGYPLPSYYLTSNEANNVESLAAGPDFNTADAAFQALIASSRHRPQILGLTPGWLAQDEYGVGYVFNPDSKYENYWVILTAKNGD